MVYIGLLFLSMPAAGMPPVEWINPATGHRIVRLSSEAGSQSLYFNQNAWTASGDKLVITTPEGIAALDFKTRKTDLVAPDAKNIRGIAVGPKSRQVYYVRQIGGRLIAFATDLDTRVTRR